MRAEVGPLPNPLPEGEGIGSRLKVERKAAPSPWPSPGDGEPIMHTLHNLHNEIEQFFDVSDLCIRSCDSICSAEVFCVHMHVGGMGQGERERLSGLTPTARHRMRERGVA